MSTPTKVSVTIPATTTQTVRDPVSKDDFVPTRVEWEVRDSGGHTITSCWVYASNYRALLYYPDHHPAPECVPRPPRWFWAALSDMTAEPAEQVTS